MTAKFYRRLYYLGRFGLLIQLTVSVLLRHRQVDRYGISLGSLYFLLRVRQKDRNAQIPVARSPGRVHYVRHR